MSDVLPDGEHKVVAFDGKVVSGPIQTIVTTHIDMDTQNVYKATLSNGHWASLDATIKLGGTVNGRPFRITRWRDNEHL